MLILVAEYTVSQQGRQMPQENILEFFILFLEYKCNVVRVEGSVRQKHF